MADARASGDGDSSHEGEVENCVNKLENLDLPGDSLKQGFKLSPGKSKWYGGSSPGKVAEKSGDQERLSKASILITAITAGDIEKTAQLLDLIPHRALNKLVAWTEKTITYQMTPVLWAVTQEKTEIVRMLVDRGVNINRPGYMDNGRGITYTYSPLCTALEYCFEDIVELLLSSGADPYLRISGPRITEEEGGVVRYTTWLYPANKAIGSGDPKIVRMFLQRYDLRTVYSKNHTCLCFALTKLKLNNLYEIVKCIISHGGVLCDGSGEENPKDKGICSHFKSLLRHAFSLNYTKDRVLFRCLFNAYKLVALVCQTDYNRAQSSITRALKQYFSMFDQAKFETGQYGFIYPESEVCFNYLLNYCEGPAPLKQMCRVVIRGSLPVSNPTVYQELSLPGKLQAYVRCTEAP